MGDRLELKKCILICCNLFRNYYVSLVVREGLVWDFGKAIFDRGEFFSRFTRWLEHLQSELAFLRVVLWLFYYLIVPIKLYIFLGRMTVHSNSWNIKLNYVWFYNKLYLCPCNSNLRNPFDKFFSSPHTLLHYSPNLSTKALKAINSFLI